jgi:hypothetical protein
MTTIIKAMECGCQQLTRESISTASRGICCVSLPPMTEACRNIEFPCPQNGLMLSLSRKQ